MAISKQLAALIVLLMVSVFIIAPYIWMLMTSFKSTREIMQNPGKILPIDWTLSGYTFVLTESPFFSWFVNSAIVSVTVTVAIIFTRAANVWRGLTWRRKPGKDSCTGCI